MNEKLTSHTLDHSVPQMLVQIGEIEESEIRHHPDRNRLLRTLGTEWNTMKYELASEKTIEKNMSFLLCSDGFWEPIDEAKMEQIFQESQSSEEWLNAMVREVEKNGKNTDADNHSAIAVWIRM